MVTAASHMGKRRGAQRTTHAGTLLVREKAGLGHGPIYNRFGDPQPYARPPAGRECPAKSPVCRNPWTDFAERQLVKRTMTYRERSLVKCVLTNLRFNESNAQRHNRNGYWSNVPRGAVQIRPRLESEWGLKRQSAVGSCRPQTRPRNSASAKRNAPVQTPGHCRRKTGAIGLPLCAIQPDFHHAW